MFRTVPKPSDDPSPAVIDRIAAVTAADPTAVIGTIIVLAVLVAAGVVVLVVWLNVRARAKARITAISPAERERHYAQLECRARIASAERSLEAATKERAARLKASEIALAVQHVTLDTTRPDAATRALQAERGEPSGAGAPEAL